MKESDIGWGETTAPSPSVSDQVRPPAGWTASRSAGRATGSWAPVTSPWQAAQEADRGAPMRRAWRVSRPSASRVSGRTSSRPPSRWQVAQVAVLFGAAWPLWAAT
jgi:hypothetical protein